MDLQEPLRMAEAWRCADAAFDRLLDLDDALRDQALAAMTLDTGTRDRVLRLLVAHRLRSGPLDASIVAGADATQPALAGKCFGGWVLDREIGRGGMSVVYRAHAAEAEGDRVAAIKILTSAAVARDGIAQFERERAALARLRHPHLVTLLDAGIAPDGTAWLATALVDGHCIDEECARRALGPAAIVRLCLQVCEAVAYAHRMLVVHRDLKPSNVLVDGDGHVRVLDFGVARLIDAGDQHTRTGTRALTPAYAAPELIDGAPSSTAMDVYGLGALLYRLLAGCPPLRDDATREPLAPSRAATADERWRRATLRGDLDAIIMRALASDPRSRYASVDAFSDDLNAWLDQRPVQARGAAFAYRARRFVRRHSIGVAFGVALVLSLAAGFAAAAWQATLARRAAVQAESTLAFVTGLLEAPAPEQRGRDVRVSELLDLAAYRAVHDVDVAPAARLAVLYSVARSNHALERMPAAESAIAQARQLIAARAQGDPRIARRIELLGVEIASQSDLMRGAYAAALARIDAFAATLAADDAGGRAALALLRARLLTRADRHAEALAAIEPLRTDGGTAPATAAEAAFYAGIALEGLGRHAEGIAALEDSLAAARRIGPSARPVALRALNALATRHSERGRLAEAETMYRAALAQAGDLYGPHSIGTLAQETNLAVVLRERGKYAESEHVARDALPRAVAAFGERSYFANMLRSGLAVTLSETGRTDEALILLDELIAAVEAVHGREHTNTLIDRFNRVEFLNDAGRAREALDAALPLRETAMRVLGEKHAVTLEVDDAIGRALTALGEPKRAEALHRRSIETKTQLYGAGDGYTLIAREYLARALAAQGRLDDARNEIDAVVVGRTALVGAEHPRTLRAIRLRDGWR
jgi:serine/threonine-protein kinase